MGTLKEWFRTRREIKIINRIKDHSKKAYQCVTVFKDALLLFFSDDAKGMKNAVKRVNDIENECDNIRREIMHSLTRGELSPQVRNDLAHLIGRLDDVANSTNAAARHLAILPAGSLREIKDLLIEMVDITISCAEVLRDTIEIEIEGAIEEVDKSIAKINKLEHEVDQIHYKVLEQLNKSEYKDLSPFVALGIYELISCTEQISDNCEATGDFVKMINLRASGKLL